MRRIRSPKTIYLLVLILLISTCFAAVPALRREHRRLVIFRNLVEEAAAPEEPVLVDNILVYGFLRWKGSPALRQQLVLSRHANFSGDHELVIVTTEGSALVNSLRSQGCMLLPDAAQIHWIANGQAIVLPGRGLLAIQFATPPSSPKRSSQQP